MKKLIAILLPLCLLAFIGTGCAALQAAGQSQPGVTNPAAPASQPSGDALTEVIGGVKIGQQIASEGNSAGLPYAGLVSAGLTGLLLLLQNVAAQKHTQKVQTATADAAAAQPKTS